MKPVLRGVLALLPAAVGDVRAQEQAGREIFYPGEVFA
jgi:hypothetical protein